MTGAHDGGTHPRDAVPMVVSGHKGGRGRLEVVGDTSQGQRGGPAGRRRLKIEK